MWTFGGEMRHFPGENKVNSSVALCNAEQLLYKLFLYTKQLCSWSFSWTAQLRTVQCALCKLFLFWYRATVFLIFLKIRSGFSYLVQISHCSGCLLQYRTATVLAILFLAWTVVLVPSFFVESNGLLSMTLEQLHYLLLTWNICSSC